MEEYRMRYVTVKGMTLTDAYHESLIALKYDGELVACPDYNTNQKEINMTIVVKEPLTEPMISKLTYIGPRELQKYVMEITDGILDFAIESGKWKYTYHSRMKDQLEFVVNDLKRNPDSRRAVISLRRDEDMYSDNPACLQHIQFFIREGKLEMMVLFRSNDACKAAFENMFALIMLQKKVADMLNIPVGTYVHRANSYHCYERDFDLLDSYVNRIENSYRSDRDEVITYDYEGEFKEIMDESIPEILKEVEELKHRNNN